MTPLTLMALLALAPAPDARAADAPRPEKGPALDTSFLKLYAETRGFLNGRPAKPKVAPDGKTVFFLRSEAKSSRQKLYAFDVEAKEAKEILPPEMLLGGIDETLSQEEKARRERQRVTAGGFTDYHLDPTGTRVFLTISDRLVVYDRATKSAKELKTGGGGAVDPKWSPDGTKLAYVRGFDVYVYDLAADKESAVTTGGTAVKTHGLAEFVAQEEMHRHTGYWWSPDSKFIAYEEADHTGVEVWTIADPFKPGVKPPEQFYPRPGKKNVSVRLGVVPVAGGPTVWVGWDREKYEYLAAVQWSRLGGLTVQLQDRKQQVLSLASVDPTTGELTVILLELDRAWINLPTDLPSPLGKNFIWMRQFGEGLEIQNCSPRKGQMPDIVVPAEENPTGVVAVVPPGGADATIVYYVAPDPTQQQVRKTGLPRASKKLPGSETADHLTDEPGFHTAVFGESERSYVITSTTLNRLPQSTVFLTDKTEVGALPSVAAEPPFTPTVTVQKVGDYWTAVVRPRDFDPKKKYPVIVDVYGGPRHLHVVQAMRNWLIPQWLADQGFVVVAVDNRGTPGRGRDWERAVYQKFGTVPLEDQVKGLQELGKRFPELDPDRVGIVGWSFGGYMAANGVLRRPDVFKAAVAGAPVTDWEDYDTHYTERYMGLLPESRKAYDEASLIPLAPGLSRPLLLVHGTADDNVYFRHSLKLADALFRAGKEFEMLPLPGVTHMYTADPQVAERLWEQSVRFFKRHLGEPR